MSHEVSVLVARVGIKLLTDDMYHDAYQSCYPMYSLTTEWFVCIIQMLT